MVDIATKLRITKSRSFWSRSACMQDTVKSRFTSWSCKKSTCQTVRPKHLKADNTTHSHTVLHAHVDAYAYDAILLVTNKFVCNSMCTYILFFKKKNVYMCVCICTHSCISLYKRIVGLFIPLYLYSFCVCACVCAGT